MNKFLTNKLFISCKLSYALSAENLENQGKEKTSCNKESKEKLISEELSEVTCQSE